MESTFSPIWRFLPHDMDLGSFSKSIIKLCWSRPRLKKPSMRAKNTNTLGPFFGANIRFTSPFCQPNCCLLHLSFKKPMSLSHNWPLFFFRAFKQKSTAIGTHEVPWWKRNEVSVGPSGQETYLRTTHFRR